MFGVYLDKIHRIVVSLRFSLLTVFLLLFVFTTIIIISLLSFHFYKVVMNAAYLLMDNTSYSVLYELDSQLLPAQNATLDASRNIKDGIIDVHNQDSLTEYLVHQLRDLPMVEAVFWGDLQGNFSYVKNISDGGFFAEQITRTNTVVNAVDIYMDKDHQVTKRSPIVSTFEHRVRPWFTNALNKKSTVWIDTYLYNLGAPVYGATVATPVISRAGVNLGVIGADISLASMTAYLAKQKFTSHAQVYIVSASGKLIAAPTMHQKNIMDITSRPWLKAAFALYKNYNNGEVFRFDINGVNYLATFKSIPGLHNDWMTAVIVPESDFTEKIQEVGLLYSFFNFITFLIGIAILSALVTRVVTPIKRLVLETEKIKNFDLREPFKLTSRINEVIELSDAISSMKNGLRSFQKYVPASLVRQLIETGENAKAGGNKRQLAIFFSDINDFTSISERMDSNQLVNEMNDYLEILTGIIVKHKGTIDKYIGDSVMAFWGAPAPLEQMCQHAALAALECLSDSRKLNTMWLQQSLMPFITRIGIHFGDAIVGSIGSTERLNYTALGDSVNIASRLVNTNRIYGTSILVSDAVYQQIKDKFVFRLIDEVRLKGKEEKTALYELLAEKKEQVQFDVTIYCKEFEFAFNDYRARKWEMALQRFKECLNIFPEDTVAPIFIERCKYFQHHPPDSNWDGIWKLN